MLSCMFLGHFCSHIKSQSSVPKIKTHETTVTTWNHSNSLTNPLRNQEDEGKAEEKVHLQAKMKCQKLSHKITVMAEIKRSRSWDESATA